jgi:hypothetical protein
MAVDFKTPKRGCAIRVGLFLKLDVLQRNTDR